MKRTKIHTFATALLGVGLLTAPLANAQTTLTNVNFVNSGDTAPLEATLNGPNGGAGTTWNQTHLATSLDTGSGALVLVDSTNVATSITYDTDWVEPVNGLL